MEWVNLIDRRHELVQLAAWIDWEAFSQQWSPWFTSTTGRPALATRLMAALLYLKHVYALSDEDVVERWTQNPYWQHFRGERYFRHELPCDPSSLVRWRQRIGEEGLDGCWRTPSRPRRQQASSSAKAWSTWCWTRWCSPRPLRIRRIVGC